MIRDATGIVLAGGLSTRFGSDKALAEWRGRTLVEAVCASLLSALPRVLVVSKRGQSRPVLNARVTLVEDLRELRHPFSGLEAGLAVCPTPWAFAAACDMPFISPDSIRRLADERRGARAVAARVGGQAQPWGAFYARGILPALSAHLDRELGARAFLESIDTAWVDATPADDYVDLDDKAAYRWRAAPRSPRCSSRLIAGRPGVPGTGCSRPCRG